MARVTVPTPHKLWPHPLTYVRLRSVPLPCWSHSTLTVSEQLLRMACRNTVQINFTNEESSLKRCEQEKLKYSIDSSRESLRMKIINTSLLVFTYCQHRPLRLARQGSSCWKAVPSVWGCLPPCLWGCYQTVPCRKHQMPSSALNM